MQSLWSKTAELPKKEALAENIQIQNVVIGAGMAGILTAYFLKKEGVPVIVLEAKEIGSGQTKNTTAKITSQHGLIYSDMIKKAGRNRAKDYAMANEAAIKEYETMICKEGISCHFEKLPSFLYSTTETGKEQLEKEARAAKMLGIDALFIEGNKIKELPFSVTGAVCFEHQAQFHPLEFIRHLAMELEIYENTNVLSVKGHKIFTNRGTIIAENIIFATHYPFLNVPGFYFLRQHQSRSYVLALEGEKIAKFSGMYYGMDEGGLSFRSEKNILLFGGGSHRTGKYKKEKDSCCQGAEKNNRTKNKGYQYLRCLAKKYYPNAQEITNWSAQDCMTHDKIPFIGKYSIFRPYWYVATGFQKWGMTSSMISAMIICDLICGRENRYQKVFSPQRFLLRAGIKNLCMDIWESAAGLTKGLFAKKEQRCRHMGCRLEWNEEEQCLECPCHGSRFDKTGKLLDNPAQKNL